MKKSLRVGKLWDMIFSMMMLEKQAYVKWFRGYFQGIHDKQLLQY